MNSELYYRHSGQFTPVGVLAGLLAGAGSGALLAWGVEHFVDWAREAHLSAILPVTAGMAIGAIVGFTLRHFHVRSLWIAVSTAAVASALTLYLSWAVYVQVLLARAGEQDTLAELWLNPPVIWSVMQQITVEGVWSVSRWRPAGWQLWALWTTEAVLVCGGAIVVARKLVDCDAFCERCERWCEGVESLARINAGDRDALRRRMEMKELSHLEAVGRVVEGTRNWFRVDLHGCSQCQDLNLLAIAHVTWDPQQGKETQWRTPVVRNLFLSQDEVRVLRKVAARLNAAEASPSGELGRAVN